MKTNKRKYFEYDLTELKDNKGGYIVQDDNEILNNKVKELKNIRLILSKSYFLVKKKINKYLFFLL